MKYTTGLVFFVCFLWSCKNDSHQRQTSLKNIDIYEAKQTDLSDVSEILAFAIGLNSQNQAGGELVGIHHSGTLTQINIPNCTPCIIEDMISVPNGLILKGKLSIINIGDNSLKQSSLAYWDFRKITSLFEKPISKLRYENGFISFESSHENLLYVTRLDGQVVSTMQLNSWFDFSLQGSQKVLISNSDPWPKSEDDFFFVENGEQLLGGHQYVLDTNYEVVSTPESATTCHRGQYFWKTFSSQQDSYTRSIVPASFEPGATTWQDNHHIFIRSQDKQKAQAISLYAQIPNALSSPHSFRKIDHRRNLIFDGYNIFHKSAVLEPFTKISYDFFDLDYIVSVFSTQDGFINQLIGISKDGYLAPISPKTGRIPYKLKKKILHPQAHSLDLFKLGQHRFAFDRKNGDISQLVEETRNIALEKILTLKKFIDIESIFVIEDELFIYGYHSLNHVNLDTKKLTKVSNEGCLVLAFDLDSDDQISTLEKCNNLFNLAKYSMQNQSMPINIFNQNLNDSYVAKFLSDPHLGQLLIDVENPKVNISKVNQQNCDYNQIALNDENDSIETRDEKDDLAQLGSYIRSHNGEIMRLFSISENQILLSGKTAYGNQNTIFYRGLNKEVHLEQLDGFEIENALVMKTGELMLAGRYEGKPKVQIFNFGTLEGIDIHNNNQFYIKNILQPSSSPYTLGDESISNSLNN